MNRKIISGTSDDNRAETGAAGKPKLPHFLKVIISISDAHMTIMELISAVSFLDALASLGSMFESQSLSE